LAVTDLTGMARAVPAAPLGVVAAGSMAVPDVLAGLESDRAGLGFIRRFMLFFGPVSSVFDFATFGVMLWIFHADAPLFRSGWFVESLATQTLVIFAIRTRRIPFFRSHPSVPLLLAALGAVTVGALLPATPLARTLGFEPLPGLFFVALALMVVCYLVLIDRKTLVLPHRARGPGDQAPQSRLPPAPPRRPLHHRRQPSRPIPASGIRVARGQRHEASYAKTGTARRAAGAKRGMV
jgi:Mg2+-importing ATPase